MIETFSQSRIDLFLPNGKWNSKSLSGLDQDAEEG